MCDCKAFIALAFKLPLQLTESGKIAIIEETHLALIAIYKKIRRNTTKAMQSFLLNTLVALKTIAPKIELIPISSHNKKEQRQGYA